MDDEKVLLNAKELLCEIGLLFQIQDDYLDVYGDPQVTGKAGTDIQDGKCTWFIVEALHRATKEQKEKLLESYGSKGNGSIEAVKAIFKELNLEQVFLRFQDKTYHRLRKLIHVFKPERLRAPFLTHLCSLYKRKK